MDFDISNIEGTELFGFLDLITAFYIESRKARAHYRLYIDPTVIMCQPSFQHGFIIVKPYTTTFLLFSLLLIFIVIAPRPPHFPLFVLHYHHHNNIFIVFSSTTTTILIVFSFTTITSL